MTPPPDRPHVLTVRLAEAELERLDAFAERLEFSRSEAVRQLVRVGQAAVDQVRSETEILSLLANLDRPRQRKPRRKR